MKITILKNNRSGQENLKVIQGIRFLNKSLCLRDARDLAVDGGEFEITTIDQDVIDDVLYCFDKLNIDYTKEI